MWAVHRLDENHPKEVFDSMLLAPLPTTGRRAVAAAPSPAEAEAEMEDFGALYALVNGGVSK